MSYVSRINSDFEKSDFKSISNDYFKCLLFVCGFRNARYTDVRSRVLKRIEEKQEIFLQDLGDECVRLETIISDTNIIQNKTEDPKLLYPLGYYKYVLVIEVFFDIWYFDPKQLNGRLCRRRGLGSPNLIGFLLSLACLSADLSISLCARISR